MKMGTFTVMFQILTNSPALCTKCAASGMLAHMLDLLKEQVFWYSGIFKHVNFNRRCYSSLIPLITHLYTSIWLCFRGSGLRDDLNFLLEEDLCNVNLSSLHCEMRNSEQLLGSLGLFAH